MQIIEEENLLDNVNQMGDYLMDQLNELMDKHEIIGEVRGKGLFVGAELVKDRKTREPVARIGRRRRGRRLPEAGRHDRPYQSQPAGIQQYAVPEPCADLYSRRYR